MKPTKDDIRRVMSELGKRGARARMKATTAAQRKKIARRAGKASGAARKVAKKETT